MRKNLSSGFGVGKMLSQRLFWTGREIAWLGGRACPQVEGGATTNASRSQPQVSARPIQAFARLVCMPTSLQLGNHSQLTNRDQNQSSFQIGVLCAALEKNAPRRDDAGSASVARL